MSYDITLKTIPERYAATVQMTIPRYEDEGMVWSALVGETCRMHLTEADPCLCAVTFLDYKGKRTSRSRLEDRKGKLPRHGAILTRTARRSPLQTTYRGSYALITDVYAAMIPWIEANGYETAGPMFNIYHVSPHDTKNPDEFVTEVCYPVKKK